MFSSIKLLCYLLLCNKLPPNLAAWNSKHLFSLTASQGQEAGSCLSGEGLQAESLRLQSGCWQQRPYSRAWLEPDNPVLSSPRASAPRWLLSRGFPSTPGTSSQVAWTHSWHSSWFLPEWVIWGRRESQNGRRRFLSVLWEMLSRQFCPGHWFPSPSPVRQGGAYTVRELGGAGDRGGRRGGSWPQMYITCMHFSWKRGVKLIVRERITYVRFLYAPCTCHMKGFQWIFMDM